MLFRHVEGEWVEVARFGSIAEAQAVLDEEVGEGHGKIGEYRVVPLPRSVTVKLAFGALFVVLVGAAALSLFLFLR